MKYFVLSYPIDVMSTGLFFIFQLIKWLRVAKKVAHKTLIDFEIDSDKNIEICNEYHCFITW